MHGLEGLSHDRPLEQRFFQKHGHAAWNRSHNCRRVRGAGVIRGKQANALGNALEALHAHANSNYAHEKRHSLDSGPIHRIGILGDQRVEDYRRPDQQDIQRQKDGDEKRSEHDQAR